MKAYTDYPFIELGDIAGKVAPVREVEVLTYDRDKYALVLFDNVYQSIKAGYLYKTNNVSTIRSRKAPNVNRFDLYSLPIEDGGTSHNRKQVTEYLKTIRKRKTTYRFYTPTRMFEYSNLRASLSHFVSLYTKLDCFLLKEVKKGCGFSSIPIAESVEGRLSFLGTSLNNNHYFDYFCK